jgi:hypothetical protein
MIVYIKEGVMKKNFAFTIGFKPTMLLFLQILIKKNFQP